MSNLVTQYIRRISKLLPQKDIPEVAIPGTNHIDNPDVWNEKTIYTGEIVANINTGKLYSSDGKEVIQLAKHNGIISGMQVVAPPAAAAGVLSCPIPLDLQVTSGFVRILGKKYCHVSVTNSSSGDIKITPGGENQRYDLIYAVAGTEKYNLFDPFYKAELVAVEGPSNFRNFYNGLNDYLPQGKTIDEAILLAIVWVPANYNIPSPHNLRPWSWSCSNTNLERRLNLLPSQPYPIPNTTPAYFIDYLSQHIFEHRDPVYDPSQPGLGYRDTRVYLEDQILYCDNKNEISPDRKLYKVLHTHLCINFIDSITQGNIAIIGGNGGGSGGTNIHSDLLGLNYDDSGHIGFQRKTFIEERIPGENDCDYISAGTVPSGQYYQATRGDLWFNTETGQLFICNSDIINNAIWLPITGASVKETIDDKNKIPLNTIGNDFQPTGIIITNTPANNSYVKVEVNGKDCVVGNGTRENCDCYFSEDGGTSAKLIENIKSGDEIYWNSSCGNYHLDNNDRISLFYLVYSISGIIKPSDFNIIWGGMADFPQND